MKKMASCTWVGLLLGLLTSTQANATLVSYNANSVDLVHSSVSNVTWTRDANLLGSLIASSADLNMNGVKDVIDHIIDLSPSVLVSPYGSDLYFLTANDFSNNGTTTWFGATAFVNYLNNISYAGSSNWYLPTEVFFDYADGYSTQNNGSVKGEELVELYYGESVTSGDNTNPGGNFINAPEEFGYWTGTEENDTDAWALLLPDGYQTISDKSANMFYARAVTAGLVATVSPVAEPKAAWLFVFGLLGLIGITYRKQAGLL